MTIQFKNIEELKEDKDFLELVPRASGEDYARLKESIEKNGFNAGMSRIFITPDGTILDGYTRYQIAKELSIEKVPVEVKELDGETEEEAKLLAKLYILDLNMSRRHLSTAQKAELALKIEQIEAEKARVRRLSKLKNYLQEEGKRIPQEEFAQIQNEIRELENAPAAPKSPKSKNPDFMHPRSLASRDANEDFQGGKASEIAAKKVGVSPRTVERAKKIKEIAEKNPEIKEEWEKAKRGEIGVKTLYEKAKKVQEVEKRKSAPVETSITGFQKGTLLSNLQKMQNNSADTIIADRASIENTSNIIEEVRRVAKDDAHLYLIVHDPSNLFAVKDAVLKYFTVADVIVWEMDKKRNGRRTAFIIKAVSKRNRTDLNPTDLIQGGLIEVGKALIENSTIPGELVLVLNSGNGELPAVAKAGGRAFCAVEEDLYKWRTAQVKWKELVKKARGKEEANPHTQELVRWFWLGLRKMPQEEFDKQTGRFFATEGKAAKELLKKFSIDRIKETAEKMVQDKFWKDKATLSLLLSKWAVISMAKTEHFTDGLIQQPMDFSDIE